MSAYVMAAARAVSRFLSCTAGTTLPMPSPATGGAVLVTVESTPARGSGGGAATKLRDRRGAAPPPTGAYGRREAVDGGAPSCVARLAAPWLANTADADKRPTTGMFWRRCGTLANRSNVLMRPATGAGAAAACAGGGTAAAAAPPPPAPPPPPLTDAAAVAIIMPLAARRDADASERSDATLRESSPTDREASRCVGDSDGGAGAGAGSGVATAITAAASAGGTFSSPTTSATGAATATGAAGAAAALTGLLRATGRVAGVALQGWRWGA